MERVDPTSVIALATIMDLVLSADDPPLTPARRAGLLDILAHMHPDHPLRALTAPPPTAGTGTAVVTRP